MNKIKFIKGSGVLVVILSAITFSIYVTSNFASSEHYSILQQKYEQDIINTYEKNIDNIDDFYDIMLEKNDI